MLKAVRIERSGSSRILRFVRPELLNFLSTYVLDEIDSALDSLDSSVKRLIFTGSEECFASGADLREMAELKACDAAAFARRGQQLMARVAGLSQTTVAAVNGVCYGGALDLALACDIRIASPNATFCHPGTGLGIITGWGGTQRLPKLVGPAAALKMFFTASPITAGRAFEIGLVDLVTDDIFNNRLIRLEAEPTEVL